MNRGKEGEQNKPDKPERRERPDGMVQYRPPSADLQELQYRFACRSERAKGHFCQRLIANG
ncbi:MAG: hypothetical protein ABIL70_04855 [candidate division WOR-3 bacterium]